MKKGFTRALRKHPWIGLLLQIAFAVLAVVLLITGLLLENVLFFLATTMSALGGVATRRAIHLERERQMRSGPKVSRPKPASSGPRASKPKTGGAKPPSSPGGVVRCTETKKPTKECDCASRHITTDAKSAQFGRPIGSPYGHRKKAGNSDKAKTGG